MKKIYKVLARADWVNAMATGVFTGVGIDNKDGYIHFSTADQVEETVAKHFKNEKDLLLISFDADKFGDALKWETSRNGDLFPHLYSEAGVSLALDVQPLTDLDDGNHEFPETY